METLMVIRILVPLGISPRGAFIWDLALLLLSCCSGVAAERLTVPPVSINCPFPK